MEPRDVIKQARAEKGLTQRELADLLPVGLDAVRAYERGRDRPSQRTATALDDALGTGGTIAAAYGFSSPVDVSELRDRVAELEQQVGFLLERQKAIVQRRARPPRRRTEDTP